MKNLKNISKQTNKETTSHAYTLSYANIATNVTSAELNAVENKNNLQGGTIKLLP